MFLTSNSHGHGALHLETIVRNDWTLQRKLIALNKKGIVLNPLILQNKITITNSESNCCIAEALNPPLLGNLYNLYVNTSFPDTSSSDRLIKFTANKQEGKLPTKYLGIGQ